MGHLTINRMYEDKFDSPTKDMAKHNLIMKILDTILSCPFLTERDTDLYAYKLPVFFLLVLNTFFLVWIMLVRLDKEWG